jgi:hypothetical protein
MKAGILKIVCPAEMLFRMLMLKLLVRYLERIQPKTIAEIELQLK